MEAPKTLEEYMALNKKKALLHDLDYIKSLPDVFLSGVGDVDSHRWKYNILPYMYPWFGREITLVVLVDNMFYSNAVCCEELSSASIIFEWIKEIID